MALSRRGILAALFSPLVARRSRPVAFSNEITGGQGALVRPAIKSPNFVTGVSGWTIDRDGSAEFNNLSIRGTFNGTDFVINAAGAFFYSGAPATGNLIASIASVDGTDAHGNPYLAGVTSMQGGAWAALKNGQLFVGGGTPTFANELLAGAVTFKQSTGQVTVLGGTTATATDAPLMLLTPGSGTGANDPVWLLEDQDGTADVNAQIAGHLTVAGLEPAQVPLTANAAAAQTADLMDLKVNGSTKLSVDPSGNLTAVGTVAGITTGHAQDTANSTTTSTVYAASSVALSTSIVLGPSGKFVASMLVRCDNSGANNTLSGMLITGSVSGTIMNPTDATSIQWNQTTSAGPFETRQFHTGTPGETITVTAQHRVTTGTGTFRYRDLLVQSLPV